MMRNQFTADSAGQAQAILGAWMTGNIELFCHELDRVEQCSMETAGPEEAERMELLQAIAADLRVPALQPAANDPANVYGSLLRHLAFAHKKARPVSPKRALVLQ